MGGGVLACYVPPGLVDEALAVTGRAHRRFRSLPARLGVYFVLALCLFSGASYGSVIAKLVSGRRGGLGAAGWRLPSTTALTKLRRRLGAAPFELLFQRLSGTSVCRRTPWSHAFGLLLVAWDGTNVDMADSPANAEAFGRPSCKKGAAGNPQSRLVVLIACGSRRIIDAAFGTYRTGERALAERILPALRPGMLVLADRGFFSYRLWCAAQATEAHLLWRVQADLHLPVQRVLPDGSFLSRLTDPADSTRHAKKRARRRKAGQAPPPPLAPRGPVVRVVEAVITVRTDDGTARTGHYRLATTLLDPRTAPAAELAATYAKRWACETGFREIKTYLRGTRRALRAADPEAARQELWAYLIVYQAIRHIICLAALRGDDLEPARISFTAARDAVQDAITITPRCADAHAEQIYRDLSRRLITKHVTCRTCPRMAKRPLFHFPSRQASTAPASQNATYHLAIVTPDIANAQTQHQHEHDQRRTATQPRAA
ncbi:IS4 family transposase [Streptomyces mirabilis]|uniref:IS4 family transposase n=1 Tax=Streptomyces mirabilis TaxID=68239 RepID=A0ABU3V5N4_9ACTN|nr:IS4 family transposase [Streptomyces mirabilis]MCX5355829.1 IS4 family transposase [Streptomyces mirabilis]MDU9001470.1 IS4 family transposase [Streptomyces mirabilis]